MNRGDINFAFLRGKKPTIRKQLVKDINEVFVVFIKCTFRKTGETKDGVSSEFHKLPIHLSISLMELKQELPKISEKNLHNVLHVLIFNSHIEFKEEVNNDKFVLTSAGLNAYFEEYYRSKYISDIKMYREYLLLWIPLFALLFGIITFVATAYYSKTQKILIQFEKHNMHCINSNKCKNHYRLLISYSYLNFIRTYL